MILLPELVIKSNDRLKLTTQFGPEIVVVLMSTVGLIKVHWAVTCIGVNIAVIAIMKSASCFIKRCLMGKGFSLFKKIVSWYYFVRCALGDKKSWSGLFYSAVNRCFVSVSCRFFAAGKKISVESLKNRNTGIQSALGPIFKAWL